MQCCRSQLDIHWGRERAPFRAIPVLRKGYAAWPFPHHPNLPGRNLIGPLPRISMRAPLSRFTIMLPCLPVLTCPPRECDRLWILASEIKQLQGTVNALRDELERSRIGEDQRIQQAVADANDEIVQWRDAVSALRD